MESPWICRPAAPALTGQLTHVKHKCHRCVKQPLFAAYLSQKHPSLLCWGPPKSSTWSPWPTRQPGTLLLLIKYQKHQSTTCYLKTCVGTACQQKALWGTFTAQVQGKERQSIRLTVCRRESHAKSDLITLGLREWEGDPPK